MSTETPAAPVVPADRADRADRAAAGPGTTTIAARLIARLRELGVEHLFGVPADYNLAFLDRVHGTELAFVGTCNELGAAYAADGYARLRGAGALLTTFGVGELSAVNGIGGAYAESVPVVEIVGAPATRVADAGLPMHHTMADGDFGRFERLHAEVTCDRVTLTADHAAEEMDRVLRACRQHSRPVRIALPADLVDAPAPVPEEPLVSGAPVPAELLDAFRTAAGALLAGAVRPAVLADHLAERHGAFEALADLVAAGPLPVAVMNMGKGVADESAPTFAGMYVGAGSAPATRAVVEDADCLIAVGVLISDGNSGGFSHAFPAGRTIDVQPYHARIGDASFPGLPMDQALAVLTDLVKGSVRGVLPVLPARPAAPAGAPDEPLTQAVLWDRFAAFVRPGDVVAAEQGTSFFGVAETRMPAGVTVVAQVLWSSIGYTLPAALGTCVAAPHRRTVLAIGDGSLQLTAQEIGTFARTGSTPVILVVNNGGYSIERAIHPTDAPYNDIAPWRYTELPAALGCGDHALAFRATTPAELDAALAAADRNPDRMVLVEAVVGPEDYPGRLAAIAAKYRRPAPASQA
ncbi:alpha-keto acid decarboxylase family protein [Yinghuangia soli]|uniref:Alpha-keto-acid decarboxylase n=1 Tax=Yinghuangia soli TaxID=2908204 RepID=A0AA41U2K0_9ACTN|nr:thiamine pyrophosphate-binding protein [Yinghuangia soli]MCF2528722.1 thiamine pyrophosphate-dependent enzyme [Yinghuangia soli]